MALIAVGVYFAFIRPRPADHQPPPTPTKQATATDAQMSGSGMKSDERKSRPPELEVTNDPSQPEESVDRDRLRLWHSADEFSAFNAELVAVRGDVAEMRLPNGTMTSVRIDSLSKRDQEFLRSHDAEETLDTPIRGSLNDLRSDAAYLLRESDGVQRVERLVAVDRPQHRIIHIRDWHTLPFEFFAADLRDQDQSISDEEITRHYTESGAVTKIVQASQRELLRWLGRYQGVHRVYLEGLSDADMPAYLASVRAVGRRGADMLPPHFGAAAQSLVVGDVDEVVAAEDENSFKAAADEARRQFVFDGPANLERERAVVRRLIKDELSVIVLGGDHDLSRAVREIGGVEYLRVTVEGYLEDEQN